MGETKLTDEQFTNMLSIIAERYGAKLTSVDLEQRWIEIDCPEESKVDCSVAMGELLQTIE